MSLDKRKKITMTASWSGCRKNTQTVGIICIDVEVANHKMEEVWRGRVISNFCCSHHENNRERESERSKVQNPGMTNMAVNYIRFKLGERQKDKQRFLCVCQFEKYLNINLFYLKIRLWNVGIFLWSGSSIAPC